MNNLQKKRVAQMVAEVATENGKLAHEDDILTHIAPRREGAIDGDPKIDAMLEALGL